MKDYACMQVNHHKDISVAIVEMQNQGWHLNAYQATGYGGEAKHCSLFEEATKRICPKV